MKFLLKLLIRLILLAVLTFIFVVIFEHGTQNFADNAKIEAAHFVTFLKGTSLGQKYLPSAPTPTPTPVPTPAPIATSEPTATPIPRPTPLYTPTPVPTAKPSAGPPTSWQQMQGTKVGAAMDAPIGGGSTPSPSH